MPTAPAVDPAAERPNHGNRGDYGGTTWTDVAPGHRDSDRRDGDRNWEGRRDGSRDGHRDGYRGDHRGNHGGHGHSHHRHTRFCSHWRSGYYGYYGGYYGHRYYSPWYWPWWPSVYVEVDSYSADDGWGAIDMDISPERAEVFINGQSIGIADEYDGFPTYLWLEKGTYDVAVYAVGYETIFRQVTIYPGLVIDMEDSMRRGESIHPDDYGPTSTERRDARLERNREREAAVAEAEARAAEARERPTDTVAGGVGRLFLSVLPVDTAVYLDGHFLGTADEVGRLSAGLVVEPGEHLVEFVRPGFETYREEVVVPSGEKLTIEMELDRD